MIVCCRCDVAAVNVSGHNALDIARYWNHVKCASFLEKTLCNVVPNQSANYFSLNPLFCASDLRRNSSWVSSAMTRETSKFIIFSSNLQPLLTTGDGRTVRLVVLDRVHLARQLDKNPLAVFLGLEDSSPESHAWFAVRLSDGDDVEFRKSSADYFPEAFPRSRDVLLLEKPHAGVFAGAHSVMQWLDRNKFCSTCSSAMSITDGGHKLVCDNLHCRCRKGNIDGSGVICFVKSF